MTQVHPETPTLTRHLLGNLMAKTEGPELISLLVNCPLLIDFFDSCVKTFEHHQVTIQSIVKNISSAVRRAGISQLFGAQGSVNIQGEEQQKLDILANQVNSVCFSWSRFIDTITTFTRRFSSVSWETRTLVAFWSPKRWTMWLKWRLRNPEFLSSVSTL